MTEAILIDGKAKAAQLRAQIAAAAAELAAERRVVPGLAVVLVGDNPASHIYVRNKVRQTAEAGMRSFEFRLSAEASEPDVLAQVARLNADPEVDGILVQLPLPRQVSADAVIDVIDPGKDVDGFHLLNVGRLATGRAREALVPCTPQGCLMLIKDHVPALAGKRALVIGRSNIVGKPMAMLLLQEHCTVTLAHSRTADLAAEVGRAEIVVAAAGQAELIKGAWIRPGAVVIDVGMNRVDLGGGKTRLVGDVEFEVARERAGAITPVPGGVGPMTIACLLRNTLIAACRRRGLPPPAL